MESIWGAGVDGLVDKRTKCSIAVDLVSVDIAAVRTGRLRRMKATDDEDEEDRCGANERWTYL